MGNDQSHDAQQLTGVLPSAAAHRVTAKPLVSVRTTELSPLAVHTPVLVASSGGCATRPPHDDGDANISALHIEPPAHALLRPEPIAASVRDDAPESVRKAQTLAAFADVCSEIVPQFLYVSNARVAGDRDALAALGITHVVDCCAELTRSASIPLPTNIERLELALRDSVHEDLSWFIYQSIEFIALVRRSSPSNRVLIHCHQGVSRSCALAATYIMFVQYQQQTTTASFRDALAVVKAKRPIASPNAAFLCQLIEWERELAGVGSPVTTLFRLAPHAAHDPATFVLKSCFAPHSTLRERIVVPLQPSTNNITEAIRPYLYKRGVFVYLDSSGPADTSNAYRVVVWRGSASAIPNGVAVAIELAQQIARVRLAAQQPSATWLRSDSPLDIVEVVDKDDSGTDVDHFGYAAELVWLVQDANVQGEDPVDPRPLQQPPSYSSEDSVSVAVALSDDVADDNKPQLFVLDGQVSDASWDRLADYDADDLTPCDAFLLLQPTDQHHFLWVGTDVTVDTEALRRSAVNHAQTVMMTQSSDAEIEVVPSGCESDAFWTAFERGY